jgi:hypothetical protein
VAARLSHLKVLSVGMIGDPPGDSCTAVDGVHDTLGVGSSARSFFGGAAVSFGVTRVDGLLTTRPAKIIEWPKL